MPTAHPESVSGSLGALSLEPLPPRSRAIDRTLQSEQLARRAISRKLSESS